MSIWDAIGSVADKIPFVRFSNDDGRSRGGKSRRNEPEYDEEYEPYDNYGQANYDDYGQGGYDPGSWQTDEVDDRPLYDDGSMTEDAEYDLGGNVYGRAGAKPMKKSSRQQSGSKRGGFLSGLLSRISNRGQEEDYDDEPQEDDWEEPEAYTPRNPGAPAYQPPRQQPQKAGNVVSLNEQRRNQQQGYTPKAATGQRPPAQAPRYDEDAQQSTTLICLVRRQDDAGEIIQQMIDGGNVIVNMEEITEELKTRVLDMISGAAFALGCSIKRFSFRNYYITTGDVKVVTNITTPVREAGREREAGGYDDDRRGSSGGYRPHDWS